MAYFYSPAGNSQQFDANGNPLSGGKVYTYLAGSTTPVATYTSVTGATAQANPIVLNTLGLPASPIWLNGGVAVKFVITDAAGVTLQTIDNISGTNDTTTTPTEWVTSGLVPTFISATSFSVPGDQTGVLHVRRRLRTSNTAGTIYSTITASSFGSNVTTVTVSNDSGALDSGISVVAYGLLADDNPSIPESVVAKAFRRTALGAVVDRAYAEYTANANLTAVIPGDDTVPQNTEGTQILSVSLTPKSTTNRVRLRFQCEFSASDVNVALGGAIFSSGSANALRASFASAYGASFAHPLVIEHEYVPGVTSALTFTVRVGPLSANTVRLNGTMAGRLLGGAVGSTLVVEEIAA